MSLEQEHICPDCDRKAIYISVGDINKQAPCTDCQLIRMGRGDEVRNRKEESGEIEEVDSFE